jgi:hypothetical protein
MAYACLTSNSFLDFNLIQLRFLEGGLGGFVLGLKHRASGGEVIDGWLSG